MLLKKCNECHETKPAEANFFKDKGFRDGYYSRCKVCKQKQTLAIRSKKKEEYNAYMKKYRAEHPDTPATRARDRRKSLRLRYGITEGEYNEILESQGGTCALCDAKPGSKRPFHVDHDHNTNRVRGVLCPGHNIAIAILDNKELLEKALIYTGVELILKKSST